MKIKKVRSRAYEFPFIIRTPKVMKENLPLIVFLHGAGERGSGASLELVDVHGFSHFMTEDREFDCVFVEPQCPTDSFWVAKIPLIYDFINRISEEYHCDRSRISLTGLSMGGYGTWYTAMAYPDLFAAIAPVCGGGMPWNASVLTMPVWAFHGAKDTCVLPSESENMIASMRNAGLSPKLTIYPDREHNCWDDAYSEELLIWLLEQKKAPEREIPIARVITPEKIDYEKEGICFYEGVVYSNIVQDLKMDIACPKDAKGLCPTVIWVHGGSWTSEDLTRKYCPSTQLAHLNKEGFVTVSIDYRMAQVSPFPADIEDCKAAVRFLRAHAEQYQIDPDRIAVWGESAGGHLVELMAYSEDSEFMNELYPEYSSRLQAVIPWYAPIDLRFDLEKEEEDSPLPLLFAYPTKKEQDYWMEKASPITYVGRKNPPTLLMHGNKDRLVSYEQSVTMLYALLEAGNDADLVTVNGQGHGFFDGDAYYERIYAFLKEKLQ